MNNYCEYFREIGIKDVNRSIELMKEAIAFNKLDLSDYIVFTEAATGEFIYTPIIAAMAGAKQVYAITRDSSYGFIEEVSQGTLALAELCGVKEQVTIVYDKEHLNKADIITNLGFVRPIDESDIRRMKKTAVIPYMCEAWEVRAGDVDLEACRERNIKVMGTNEDFPGLDVFNYSGALAVKLLLDCGIEIYKSRIVIVSKDKFGKVIFNTLKKFSEEVFLIDKICEEAYETLRNIDALIIADYTSSEVYVGDTKAFITPQELKELSSKVNIIQFAGSVNYDDVIKVDINIYPNYEVGSFRMGKTLAYLGPKPIIDLHCAGLKVGELMLKGEAKGSKLCQEI